MLDIDVRSPQGMLRLGYAAVPIVAGLDKFTELLVDWEQYLSPPARRMLPLRDRTFMRLVGVVEIGAGALTFARPRWGGYVVAAWLGGITANLLASRHFDIAARDALLAVGAIALAKLSAEGAEAREAPRLPGRMAQPSEPAADAFTHAVRREVPATSAP